MRLYLLAFDHRTSFERMFGVPATRLADAKALVYEGFLQAVEETVPRDAAGILVDLEYGAHVARKARQASLTFAVPVERSGQAEFEFEDGDAFGEQIERVDPTFAKALVRYNPDGDSALNRRQAQRLRRLSDWLRERERKLMLELLVPLDDDQPADELESTLRPELMRAAIAELQDAGVEPDLWKIEGVTSREACSQIAAVARRDGRADVRCLVLGRGASTGKVEEWLRASAGVPGYVGFAIGRSIFERPLAGFLAGALGRTAAAAAVARNYRHFVEVYERACVAA